MSKQRLGKCNKNTQFLCQLDRECKPSVWHVFAMVFSRFLLLVFKESSSQLLVKEWDLNTGKLSTGDIPKSG